MDRFTKDKLKSINKIQARMYYELQHIEHLLFRKHPRSLPGVLNIGSKVFKASVKIKAMAIEIKVIKETPIPKYPKGGNYMCGIVGETGGEMVKTSCGTIINPIQSVHFDPAINKVVKINDLHVVVGDNHELNKAVINAIKKLQPSNPHYKH